MKKIKILLVTILFSITAFGQTYKDYYSKWDKNRPARSKTLYIILHTTEAPDKSSLSSVHTFGTCNYLVATNGTIYRIISKGKIAKHAGRSMWSGHSNLSNSSIGIEIVGHHDKEPTSKQLVALKGLIKTLKGIYKLGDEKVLCHSMVAYGSPNQWFPNNHRGRKRCGMLFATKKIRTAMGLKNIFTFDPDVKANRLEVADSYLESVLYASAAISPKKDIPGITEPQVEDEESFEGFKTIGKEGAWKIAGNEYNLATTIYFLVDGRVRTGAELSKSELNSLHEKTKVLVGYIYGGSISKKRTAYSVVGEGWDFPSTYYRFPDGKVITGDDVDGSLMPKGTIILFRK